MYVLVWYYVYIYTVAKKSSLKLQRNGTFIVQIQQTKIKVNIIIINIVSFFNLFT